MIKNLYCDGSTAFKNPSPYGIAWAFIVTDENDEKIYEEAGVVTAQNCKGFKASNNLAEMLAAVKALEYASNNLDYIIRVSVGPAELTLYSDSELTLNRLFRGYSMKLLPKNVQDRATAVVSKIKRDYYVHLQPVLLAGHPTKKQLAEGFKTKNNWNYPVSKWNVECDKLCSDAARKLIPSDGTSVA